ncbi:hypothetical protein OQA88_696 [Cercophora sp. LCS_1]
MKVLGREKLTVADLLELPPMQDLVQDRDLQGCYLAICIKKMDVNPQYPTTLIDDISYKVGIYIGSAVNKRGGIKTRIGQHLSEIQRPRDGKPPRKIAGCRRFYEFAGREGVELFFKPIALYSYADPRGFSHSILSEGLGMTLFNVVRGPRPSGRSKGPGNTNNFLYHNQATSSCCRLSKAHSATLWI